MTRHSYTVELLITGTNGKTRFGKCHRSGWDMTVAQACRSAVDHSTWYWSDVAHVKAVRVYIEGKGWVDPAGESSAQAQTQEVNHG